MDTYLYLVHLVLVVGLPVVGVLGLIGAVVGFLDLRERNF